MALGNFFKDPELTWNSLPHRHVEKAIVRRSGSGSSAQIP